MNLLSTRQQFIKLSGRYDLATTVVTEFDTDAGADFFINSGMRFLDREFKTKKSQGSYFEEISSGDFYITFPLCAAVEEVWCNDSEGRWQVYKYPQKSLREVYTGLVFASTGGSPAFYHPINLRSIQGDSYDDLGEFFSYMEEGEKGNYNGIILIPKADTTLLIEVIGKFYTKEMTANIDENFWTNVAPETLLKAALYQLEVFYRNTEGANDWLKAINLEGSQLEKDLVEEESNDMEVME